MRYLITGFRSHCLMFHLGNPVTDVNDISCGMSTVKAVGLIYFRPYNTNILPSSTAY